nr:uncharacterized protein LOC121117784 [Lepeophtheirus salmonis]
MDCYVSPPRPDSHIKNLQINLEGTCNGADMEKFEPNQEASISSLRPFTPKTLDYSTIHECLSTTSYDSSNASIEPPFKERYAPYDDHKWANLGKDILSRDAVQYTRALSLQNHLLSFLRIKGNSMKGMSNTNKNSVIFVVIEGEISVVLHSCKKQFYAKKGDSFHVPPNFSYNLINKKVREAELTIFQF